MKQRIYFILASFFIAVSFIFGQSHDEKNSSFIPIAVPVVTVEEAEKLNEEAKEFALAEMEKREPFFRLYQNSKMETVCFQGTVRATSVIPDPETNDYDNCLYALFLEIDSILSEVSPGAGYSSEVIMNVPIMKDKTVLRENMFLPGDKVWCTCAEYDTMPQGIQEIQISDDIQSYEHQQYYPFQISKISAFQEGGNRSFAKREITILPIQSLEFDEEADKQRTNRIKSEIARIEEELKHHGESFAAWKEEYKPIDEKYRQLAKEAFSCWINDGFFAAGGHVGGSESSYQTADYIESILPYKNYLKKNNIDLIVVRIPSRGDFAARVLASDDFQENPAWIEHYYECLKNDIEIVDPMPEMWNHRFDLPLFYYYTNQEEYHPFEGTYYYASVSLAEVLKRYQYDKTEPLSLKRVKVEYTDNKFIYPAGNPKFASNIEYNQVIFGKRVLDDLPSNSGSPFLFLSNSYFGKFLIKDLGLPYYCAYQLQTIPDWSYQQSLGTSMLYNLISSPQLLAKRRAVIMLGSSNRELWGKFHELPKYILDDAKSISLEQTIPLDSPDLSVVAKDQILFSHDENGGTTIKADNNVFSFAFTVPNCEGKSICMIRINFVEAGRCKFTLYDTDTNELFESSIQMPSGSNIHQDFFVPVSDRARNIGINFSSTKSLTFRNIELWYY